MEKWESYLREIIRMPIQDIYLERGSKIKQLLSNLSKYRFDLELQFKNVQKNEDFSISELIGAAQRYIYGNFPDAIIHSCYSVEIGLLAKLDRILNNEEKARQREPTLGRIIHLSYDALILDKKNRRLKKAVERILEIRNIHNHPANLLSGLILSFKAYNELLSATNLDPVTIEAGLKILSEVLEEREAKLLLKMYKPEDIAKAIKTIDSMSTFEWCANKNYIKSLKREVDKSVQDIKTKLLAGKDVDDLRNDFQEYILRKEALESLENARFVLRNVDIL